MNPIILTHGLSRCFGAVWAVEGLDLAIPRGGVCGFLGPNGSGKTTTLRMLLGLMRPTRGDAEVLGFPAGDRRALARIGALVESPSLYPHLTGEENLRVTAHLRGCPEVRIPEVLAQVGLASAGSKLVKAYSLGMKQRLALALALLPRPDLLILDEPTNGLDPSGIQEMRDLIRRLPGETGATVFLSSHLLSEVEQVATHLVILQKGRLRFQGTLEELHASRAPRLEVETEAELALPLLVEQGFSVRSVGGSLLIDAPRERVPEVARILVARGLPVFRLAAQTHTLETRFMELMEEA